MDMLKTHAILTAVALATGIAAVLWLQPQTSAGTVLVMTISFVLFNALGALRKARR